MANRLASDIFKPEQDAGEPLDITKELLSTDLIRYDVPVGGPFVTGAPQSNTLTAGRSVLLSPLATIASNALTDPLTIADVLLFREVSEGGSEGVDAAQPWNTDAEYVGVDNVQFSLVIPATEANGPFVTNDAQTLKVGRQYNLKYNADRTAAASIAAIADDAPTTAEIALMDLVGEVSEEAVDVKVIGVPSTITLEKGVSPVAERKQLELRFRGSGDINIVGWNDDEVLIFDQSNANTPVGVTGTPLTTFSVIDGETWIASTSIGFNKLHLKKVESKITLPNFRQSEPHISHPAALEGGATAFVDSVVPIGADNRCNAMTIARTNAGYFLNASLVAARENIVEIWVKNGTQDSFNVAFVDNDASIDLDAWKWDWIADTFTKSAIPTFSGQPDHITLIAKGNMGEAGHYLKVRIKDPDTVDIVNARVRILTDFLDGHVATASSYDIAYKITPVVNEVELQTISVDPAPASVHTRYHLNYVADGDFTLPSYVGLPEGSKIEILNTFGKKIAIKPELGERINGVIDEQILADGIHQTWHIQYAASTWHVTPEHVEVDNRVLIAESPNTTSGFSNEDLVIAGGRTVTEVLDEFEFLEFSWDYNTGSVWGNDVGERISRFSTRKAKLAATALSLFENQAGSDYMRCMLNGGTTFNIRVTGAMTYQHMSIYGIKGDGLVAPGTMLTTPMGYAEWHADGTGTPVTPVAGVPIPWGTIAPNVNDQNSGITFDGTTWDLPAGTWDLWASCFASANNTQPRFVFHDGTSNIGKAGAVQGGNNAGGGSGAAKATVIGPISVTLNGNTSTNGAIASGASLPSSVTIHQRSSHSAIRAEDAKINEIPILTSTGTGFAIVGVDYNVEGKFNGRQVKAAYIRWENLAHATAFGVLNNFYELKAVRDLVVNATEIDENSTYRSTAGSGESDSSIQVLSSGIVRFLMTGAGTQDSGRCLLLWTEN